MLAMVLTSESCVGSREGGEGVKVEIAKGCPVLSSGGNVEVTEAIDIGM